MKDVMKAVLQFFRNLWASPKTSATGIVLIANALRSLCSNPMAFLTNEAMIATTIMGVGLLFAADQHSKDTEKKWDANEQAKADEKK